MSSLRQSETSGIQQHDATHGTWTQSRPNSAPRTKAQNRMLRKLKRVEEGTYAPQATDTTRHRRAYRTDIEIPLDRSEMAQDSWATAKADDQKSPGVATVDDQGPHAQIEQVIDKIDKLPGPSIREEETARKVRVVAKLEEKRKRRQRDRSKELQEQAEKKKKELKQKKLELLKGPDRWKVEKEALEKKFGQTGWQPRKRLSPDSLEGIRALHASDPATYTTEVIASNFEVSAEAIRRILRSKWQPTEEQRADRMARWEKRGVKKWMDMAEKGMKPPKRWRELGAPHPKSEARKNWDDGKHNTPLAVSRAQSERGSFSAAKKKADWTEELKRAESPGDLMNLADRLM